ncbi:GNAT family N-acetyltransferase [Nocardioides bruguierae]|uniref:GNAT family N-acetyltransferase n=1 Tax=Nocardioides bruguierae TaxID=2945102 RepID=A0A9X2ID96_9ACTN|nr:GNAT family N-acetyltransferase [Nocardioides bruguierae]MCM0619042.1 GNAT family N-acetyltransferase [Nocardioides bruguierae]
MRIEPFSPRHAAGIADLCRDLGWPSYSDVDTVLKGCCAAGVIVLVAVVDDGSVVGFAQVMGDGVVQSFLAQLAVAATHRRTGIARALVDQAFAASGTERMDVLTDDAEPFYKSFPHKTKLGYRIYPA